jgi:sensor domain CHASE-containing protein
MSIRSRILLSLLTVVALYAATAYGIQSRILLPSFEDLEAEQGHRNLARTVEAIQKDVDTLDSFCHDWAAWDDTFRFVADHDDAYVRANLQVSAYENGNFDLVRVQSLDGGVPFNSFRHPDEGYALRTLRDFPDAAWPQGHPLLASTDPEVGVTGLLSTEAGTMLVSSRPIVDSLKTEPMRGWLVMGLLLSPGRVQQLRDQTRVALDVFPLGAADLSQGPPAGLPPAEQAAFARLSSGASDVLEPRSDTLLQGYTLLPDLRGRPALLVRADLPRAVMARGREALGFVLGSTLVTALLLLVVLFFLLRRTIIRPLAGLSAHVLAVGRSGDLARRMNSGRRDEFGLLSRAFDEMVGHLARTREELLERAHRDGKAEVAVSVLHNVGNVLNSVNVSLGALHAQVNEGTLADAPRLAATLASHATDLARFITEDERGRHLPAFLAAFSGSLAGDRERMLQELQALEAGVEHVRALVDGQQATAGVAAEPEPVDLAQQVEAALKLSPPLPGAAEVEVVREFEALPPLVLPRHRLLEILVNLVRNARQALRDGGTPAPRLRVAVARAGDRVRVTVTDNGPGIAPDTLARLFRQGFTTRRDGHGYGLHSSANAAHELGGTLTAHSDGPGAGARFVLELPLHLARRAA